MSFRDDSLMQLDAGDTKERRELTKILAMKPYVAGSLYRNDRYC